MGSLIGCYMITNSHSVTPSVLIPTLLSPVVPIIGYVHRVTGQESDVVGLGGW